MSFTQSENPRTPCGTPCVPSAMGTNANTADPLTVTTTIAVTIVIVTEVAINHRDEEAVARQDTVAVSLISLKGKPHVEIRAALRRETLISYVATRKIDTIRACVLVLYLPLFFSNHSRRENKIHDWRVIYCFVTKSYVFAFWMRTCSIRSCVFSTKQ